MDADLAKQVEALLDKEAIRDVISTYSRGVDRVDREGAKSAFHPDSTEDHGVYRGLSHGFIDRPSMADPQKIIAHHMSGQVMIDLKGDMADCETYFIAGVVFHPVGAKPYLADIRGRYLDRVEKREGVWKIAARVAVLDFSEQYELGAPWSIESHFIKGARFPDDLVYHFEHLSKRVHEARRPDVVSA